MASAKKYILFCAQEASFQTRSALLPYDAIMKCPERVADLRILREHAKKNVKFGHMGDKYIVDQLLIQNLTRKGNLGFHDEMPFTRIVHELTSIIEEGHVFHRYDSEWIKEIIHRPASKSFNHIVNYCDFCHKTQHKAKPIDIVKGFLVLETDDHQPITMPDIDTVDEMYETYY